MLDINYELVTEYEDDISPEGSFATGDDAEDERLVKEIEDKADRGDEWAWFRCKVEASVEVDGETFTGESHWLGGCSYENQKDFEENSGYYEDMKEEAKDDLKKKLEAAAKALTEFPA